ncbi:hypothetical protein SAMN05216251_108125 [Actinacidiphila alni]|uniref:C2H2-type domain-containing protein n=1 Tax=Actinacidiphila alni TaxID=380248 RepID=A0A1I2FZC3_9ACTN|nr:hypothetical protein SAMN05216251_108125 [Actinacidiphila alni]
MRETIGSDHHPGRPSTDQPRTDQPVAGGRAASSPDNAMEAYAFACLNCGHGWEQAYEIEHHVDASGRPFVTYLADGARVPSPLTRPSCLNCGGEHVRIMRSGQVSDIASSVRPRPRSERAEQGGRAGRDGQGGNGEHHWSVLHFLHRKHQEELPPER